MIYFAVNYEFLYIFFARRICIFSDEEMILMEEKFDNLIKTGDLFFIGEKLPSDFYQAYNIWSEEAEKDNPKAFYNLAYCSFHGEGTEQNLDKALTLYTTAFVKGIEKAGKFIVWFKAREFLGTLNYLRLFDTPPNKDTHLALERLKNNIPRLYDFCIQIKKEGCEAINKELDKLNDLIKILELNDVYHKGDQGQFLKLVDKLIQDGNEWAKQIRGVLKCSITSVVSNTRTTDLIGSPVINGTTEYIYSKPYFKYSQADYIKNVSDTRLNFTKDGSMSPFFSLPGEKTILEGKSGRSDYQYTHDGNVVDTVFLNVFYDIRYFDFFGISTLLTAFKLPVQQESEYKDDAKGKGSGFSISAIIFITIMFCAMVFCFIMASK